MIFAPVEKEIADSIATRRSEARTIRAAMEQIIAEKKLDRVFIFGPDDKYFKEGMHANFKSAPGPMLVDVDRDTRIVQLEHFHVALFHSDAALHRWLGLQTKLAGLKTKHGRYAWQGRYEQLSPEKRQGLDREQQWAKWGANELICLLTDNEADLMLRNPARDKVNPIGLKFVLKNDTTNYESLKNMVLPFPSDKIPASFPLDGQYAFFPEESIPRVGYVVLPRGSNYLLYERLSNTPLLKARWSSASGTRLYTDAKLENMEPVIYFNLPENFFQPAQLYRLEVVALPEGAFHIVEESDVCGTRFRGSAPKAADAGVSVKGEVKIAEMHFRTSRYTLREKLKTMRVGDINWDTGAIAFVMDEPLELSERMGGRYFDPLVSFDYANVPSKLEQSLQDPALYYYLCVPAVEPLDGLSLDQLAIVEQDNTLDAPFVRNTSLVTKSAEGYAKQVVARSVPKRIGNGYVLPTLGMGRDSFVVSAWVPLIDRSHFKQSRVPEPDSAVPCTLYVAQLVRIVQALKLQQSQVRQRMEERAVFFHQLEKRRSARTGVPASGDLAYFRQKEAEHLPASAKFILEADLKQLYANTITIMYRRLFPGSEQATATLPLDRG